MKKIFLFNTLFFCGIIPAQTSNWTTVKETNINYENSISFDLFTNVDGNHIIVQKGNALKYYNLGINGSASSPITIDSPAVVSPSITGNNNIIWIVYRKSSAQEITAKFSTNGGVNWNYISQNPLNTNALSIESIMSNGLLHVVYEIVNTQLLYRYWNGSQWSNNFSVSD